MINFTEFQKVMEILDASSVSSTEYDINGVTFDYAFNGVVNVSNNEIAIKVDNMLRDKFPKFSAEFGIIKIILMGIIAKFDIHDEPFNAQFISVYDRVINHFVSSHMFSSNCLPDFSNCLPSLSATLKRFDDRVNPFGSGIELRKPSEYLDAVILSDANLNLGLFSNANISLISTDMSTTLNFKNDIFVEYSATVAFENYTITCNHKCSSNNYQKLSIIIAFGGQNTSIEIENKNGWRISDVLLCLVLLDKIIDALDSRILSKIKK